LVAAVVGSAGADPEIYAAAQELGRLLVDAGFRIVSGGLSGVMEAVSRGAHESDSYMPGDTIGVLPTYNGDDANQWVDIVIPTGLQHARNTIVVSSADVVLVVGGGAGTLSEVALAWSLGRRIVAVESGGWAERLGGERLDERRHDIVHGPFPPPEAVDAAVRLCQEPRIREAEFTLGDSTHALDAE
jgi:hypothetical protein